MITADELKEYLATMQAAGITGRAKIGDIELTIPPAVVAGANAKPEERRSAKAEYDAMLFACTEGIPEDEEAQS